jgi:hypothetical protein
MARGSAFGAALIAGCALLLTGCQQQMSMEEMMKPPPRAAELDKLDEFVGKWELTCDCTMKGSDQPMKCTGTSTATWQCDKRVVVEHGEFKMGDEKFTGMGVYTWDPDDKVYRTWWFESSGRVQEGTMSYDEASRAWHMKSEHGKGTMKKVGPDSWEMTMTETTGGLFPEKVMEMKGTCKRTR